MIEKYDARDDVAKAAKSTPQESVISRVFRHFVGDLKAEPTPRHPHLSAFAAATGHVRRADELAQHFATTSVASGQVLMGQGDVAGEFMIVLEGKALVTIDDEPVAVLPRGTHFGSQALFDDEPGEDFRTPEPRRRSATVQALTDCVIGVAHRNAHGLIRDNFPELIADVSDASVPLTGPDAPLPPHISPMHPSVWRPKKS